MRRQIRLDVVDFVNQISDVILEGFHIFIYLNILH